MEFSIAMHLASLAKLGFAMPESLPEHLLPSYLNSNGVSIISL
jgi:hypothetical protein